MARSGTPTRLATHPNDFTVKDTDAKDVERARYNERSLHTLAAGTHDDFAISGAAALSPALRTPYLRHEASIREHARPGVDVLDVCCGDGLHSLTAAYNGANVTATDLAEHALKIAAIRAERAGLEIRFVPADAETLPFADHSFDVVTCAGSLSYVDLGKFLGELRRVLRPGGAFIFVDSLNHNPVYRLNRWWHYRRGRRTRATLERMPTLSTLAAIRAVFPDLNVSFHGVFSFLIPALKLVGPDRSASLLDRADRSLPALQRFAFKVAGVGHLPSR